MVTLVTLVAEATGMESKVRMKRMYINTSQLHFVLLLDVIHKLHYGYNNNVIIFLHNCIFSFTYLLL
jgi:hypothetical protein